MSTRTRNFAGRIRNFASIVMHSGRCASAIEHGRRPDARSMQVLGINPAHFDRF